ncbi:S23 ribosomal protein [Chryseobacterium carnipullorum]|uniref:S23 ribosomal protein n=1 Tax=Chryseobacterium carnipullorum TaxID=1124835 RepID=A0A376E3P9_CHRCU|nr:S23 ribosomal protein [Chryseobacterium carnipullorum]
MHNFEELLFWQKSIVLAKNVYIICQEVSNDEKFGLISQIKDLQFLFLQILRKVLVEMEVKNLIIF